MEQRKRDHIELARQAQIVEMMRDRRFFYEPLLGAHPKLDVLQTPPKFSFLGKQMRHPLWMSSMTGGTDQALHVNRNLARVAGELGLGIGLGSCRVLLDGNEQERKNRFAEFNLRPILGDDVPFMANLGIAQVASLLEKNKVSVIHDLLDKLQVDGLIVHVNPLQEWMQPEGDLWHRPGIDILKDFLSVFDIKRYKLMVKEVGQGIGPQSLKALCELPIHAIELAAIGGTNFPFLEQLRSPASSGAVDGQTSSPHALCCVGHSALEMLSWTDIWEMARKKNIELIISGGVKDYLDAHYLMSHATLPCIYGQAYGLLNHALESYEALKHHIQHELTGLYLARSFLHVKKEF